MVLHEDAQRLLAMVKASGRPPLTEMSVEDARKVYSAGRTVTQPDPPDCAEVRNLAAHGPCGMYPGNFYHGLCERYFSLMNEFVGQEFGQ